MDLGNSEIITLDEHIKKELYTALTSDVKLDVIKTLTKKYYSEIVKSKLAAQTFFFEPLQEIYNEVIEVRKQNVNDDFYFITICPYEDINISDLTKVLDKIVKKKWFKKYIYVYEQRQDKENTPYYGIHTHMIVKRDGIAKSDVIREVYNTSKNICGSKQSIDVKLLKTRSELDIKINYILGKKSTEQKQARQVIDKVMRSEYKLKSYYSLGEWRDIIPTTLQNVS